MKLTADEKARFLAQFQDPNLEMKDLERIWQRPSGTLYRWGFELGVSRPKSKGAVQLVLEQVRQYCEAVSRELLPSELKLADIKPVGIGRRLELILLLSDLHAGRLTQSFDAEVFANRLDALAERLIARVMLLQKSYNITRLHIFALGDFVVGEQLGRNITLEELEHMVLTQVYNIAIPHLVLFTQRILIVPTTITAVRGNHGVVFKGGVSKAANWDTVVYLGWQARMAQVPANRLEFNIATAMWCNYAQTLNKTWLLVHGDQFALQQGTPYNGIRNRVDRWHRALIRGFDYVAVGHFHHFGQVGEIWMNGTLLTDDDWAREVLGREGQCGQWLIGVTNKGIEWASPIWLGDIGQGGFNNAN